MIRSGRPITVAVLGEEEFTIQIREEFFEIMANLSWGEGRALARALFCSPHTYVNWRYSRNFPGIEVARRVIEWNRNGRPLTTIKQKGGPEYIL